MVRITQSFLLALVGVGIMYTPPVFPCTEVELSEAGKKRVARERKRGLVQAAASHLDVKPPLVQKTEIQDYRQYEGGSESIKGCYRPTIAQGTVKLTYQPRPGSVAVCRATVKVKKSYGLPKDGTTEIEISSGPHCR